MRFFKLPATLRLGLVNCLLIWVMMSVYRLVLMSLLTENVFKHLDVLWKGLLLDFGAISIPGSLFILFSYIPALHPYKSKKGMYFGLIFFSFFGMLFALIYGLDLVFIKILSSRISGETIGLVLSSPDTAKAFRKNVPYFALTTGVTLLVWVWWILIDWLYKALGAFARAEEKIVRLFWQSFCLLVFLIGIIKAGEYTSVLPNDAIFTNESLKESLSVNPVITLIFK
jgi:hypothetical protein